jgi:hypothetical protein
MLSILAITVQALVQPLDANRLHQPHPLSPHHLHRVGQLRLQYLFLVTFQLQKLQTTTFLTFRWPCAMLRYVLLH